jgi:regulator of sigma E protease
MAFGSILLAAIGIGLLIFVHELGHFLAARLAGVRVEVFSLGFGPRLCGVAWRGTDFRLSLVPFGGFVMVAGQDPSDRRYSARESLWAKPAGQRALFWSGGVVMNVLVALVVFPIVFRVGVEFPAPIIGQIARGGAAWEAGVQPGDRVLSIAGKPLHSFDAMLAEAALTGGRATALVLRSPARDERTVSVLPQWNPGEGRYELGVLPSTSDEPPQLEIAPGSPAAAAGLQSGDVLLRLGGEVPDGDVPRSYAALQGGAAFDVRVRRGVTELDVRVVPALAKDESPPRIGVQLLPRKVVGLRAGNAFVERLALRRGDIVLAIDGVPFTGGDLAVAKHGPDSLRLDVRRDGEVTVLAQPATAADREAFVNDVALTADDSLLLLPFPDHAAARAGMRGGDRIETIDGRPIRTFDDLRRAVERGDGKPLAITVRSLTHASTAPGWLDPQTHDLALPAHRELTIVPARPPLFDSGLVPQVVPRTELVRAASFGEALRLGTALSLDMVKQIYVGLKRMVTGDVGTQNLGGIIRISQFSYQAAKRGFTWFLYIMAMLSLNLAIVNLLPIPVLDGGHLLFVLIEKVKGSPVSSRVFGYSQMVGLVFVLMLVLFVTYNDILQLL